MERRGRLERALGIQLTAGSSRWKTPRFQAWPTGLAAVGFGGTLPERWDTGGAWAFTVSKQCPCLEMDPETAECHP